MAKKNTINVVVCSYGDGDGVTGMYFDGKLITYGDYYHNKIDDYISGFLDGMKHAGIKFKRTDVTVPLENEDEAIDGNIPEVWPNEYTVRIKE